MRAVPLAAVLLYASAAYAAAADCIVPVSDPDRPDASAFHLDAKTPACLAAAALLADVARLRAAAGFAPGELKFSIKPDAQTVNAYQLKGDIWITVAYLLSANGRDARLATLAHEIGHAVQYRDGLMAWKARARGAAYLERSRRTEAHADAIGQELLQRAGYSIDLFATGRADHLGCGGVAGLDDAVTTHPANAQRYLNAAMTNGALAQERARATALGLSAAFADSTAVGPGVVARPFAPAARISDYDKNGRVQPGRRAAASLRVPPPPAGAGPAAIVKNRLEAAAVLIVSVPFGVAVDHLANRDRIAARVMTACGTPAASRFDEDFSTLSWIQRLAADAAAALSAVHRAGGTGLPPET